MRLRAGTRGSALALEQTALVASLLGAAAAREGVEAVVEPVVISTKGDRAKDVPFSQIGPKGVFAAELQRALARGDVDVCVHSLKDLPALEPEGLAIAAVPERADPRDVLVGPPGVSLDSLAPGSVVGTSSERRRALVAERRPDLRVAELRGNVDTRLAKVARGDVDAAVLAGAGLVRLGRAAQAREWLAPGVFVPAPGQGALAVEVGADRFDGDLAWVRHVQDEPTRRAVDAERAFAAALEAGCSLPVGAFARAVHDRVELSVFVASGAVAVREQGSGTDPEGLGREVAGRVLARLSRG